VYVLEPHVHLAHSVEFVNDGSAAYRLQNVNWFPVMIGSSRDKRARIKSEVK